MKPQKLVVVSADYPLLHVRLNAAVKLGDFPPLFAEIRLLAAEHKVKSILVDARAFKKMISAVQRLQVALALVKNFIGYRVAGVISTEAFDPGLLAETMARNRGGNVKMTTSLAEAKKWLGVRAMGPELPLAHESRAR